MQNLAPEANSAAQNMTNLGEDIFKWVLTNKIRHIKRDSMNMIYAK